MDVLVLVVFGIVPVSVCFTILSVFMMFLLSNSFCISIGVGGLYVAPISIVSGLSLLDLYLALGDLDLFVSPVCVFFGVPGHSLDELSDPSSNSPGICSGDDGCVSCSSCSHDIGGSSSSHVNGGIRRRSYRPAGRTGWFHCHQSCAKW